MQASDAVKRALAGASSSSIERAPFGLTMSQITLPIAAIGDLYDPTWAAAPELYSDEIVLTMRKQSEAEARTKHYYYVYTRLDASGVSSTYIVSTLGIFRHKAILGPDVPGEWTTVTAGHFALLSTLIGGTLPSLPDNVSDYPTVVDPNLEVQVWSSENLPGDLIYAIFKNTVTKKYHVYSAPLAGQGIFMEYYMLPYARRASLKAYTPVTLPPVTSAPVTSAPVIVIPPLPVLPAGPAGPVLPAGPALVPLPAPSTTPSTLTCANYPAALAYNNAATKPTSNVVCAAPVADAKSKLTIAFSPRTVGGPLVAPFASVGIEEKDGKWSGFSYDGPGGRWIRVDVDGKKMRYTVQFDQQTWEQKEVEVKYDADKKYTFEGGSVVVTDTDPFSSGGLAVWAIVLIVVGVLLVILAIVAGGVVAFRERRRRGIGHPELEPQSYSSDTYSYSDNSGD